MGVVQTLLVALLTPITVSAACYNPGPSFPPVDRILNAGHFEQLRSKLDSAIPDILGSPDGWSTDTTSFALQVTSASEKLWDYYHTAPILGEYKDSEPTPVTGDTAFRIASISKSFTVYAVLLESKINLDDPVTKYIPELVEQQPVDRRGWHPEWDQITIRSLASQLSGITRDGGLLDLAVDTDRLLDPVSQGFPPVLERFLAPCLKNFTDRVCNGPDIIGVIASKAKVFTTNDRSTYSNLAFSLLGQVLERATGKSYSEVIASSIFQPLGMNHARTTKPKDSLGIIPHEANVWALDQGANIPTGGLYCTANDFSKYLQSILSSTLLPQAVTNAWMKPQSWSSGTNSAYGMPWEILRTAKLTPDGRAIDIVTKGGSLPGYYSLIAMIPEYGLGMSILIAGSGPARQDLSEKLISVLVPAVEELLRHEVRRQYAGTWSHWGESLSPDKKFSLQLHVDDNGPGLRVSDWVSNGIDFLPVYGSLKGMGKEAGNWQARLIPTGVYSGTAQGGLGTEKWRLIAIPERIEKNKGRILDDFCMTDVDDLTYNGFPVEEFSIFKRERKGTKQATSLLISGLRTDLIKEDESAVVEDARRFAESGRRPGYFLDVQEL